MTDPRDKVGRNPTGRPTRSSAGKRKQEARKMERLLEGTDWEDEESGVDLVQDISSE